MRTAAPSPRTDLQWAGNGFVGDPAIDLDDFQSGLAVRLIATERSALSTCGRDEDLAVVVERNRGDQFDHCPVTEDGQIVGLVELAPFMHGQREISGRVADCETPLSEANLIGADASILSFVRDADRQRCRLVVSRQMISGLVSLSDLQRLPVRAALFAMVTYFEITMADAIRREFGISSEWIKRLSKPRQTKIEDEIDRARNDDDYVDTLLFTQFADKVTILRKSPDFLWPRSKFERDMHRAEDLRNALAHANDFATTRARAAGVCEIVRSLDTWIECLLTWKIDTSYHTRKET